MRATLAIFAALLVACGQGSSELDESLPVEPEGLLEVDLYLGEGLRPDRGSLEVSSHDADEVRVVASATGWGAAGVNFRLEQRGGGARLLGRVTGATSWLFGGPQTTVRIWVPRRYSLDVTSSAGPIRIDDLNGDLRARGADSIEVTASSGSLRLRTSDGDLRISEVEGVVDARASSGEIELSWISGAVEARTGRGEIRASHMSGSLVLTSGRGGIEIRELDGKARARTERGGIFAHFSGAPEGAFETSRGNVRVMLPEGAGAQIEMVSRRGEVELAPGVELAGRRADGQAVGRLGAGGAPLRLYTARGSAQLGRW